MHIKISPEVLERGKASTLEVLVVRDFLYRMARRIPGTETKATDRSYLRPRTAFFIFLAAEFSTDGLFEHFTELDELCYLVAARDALERALAGHGLRFGAGVVAVGAYARDNAGALHALGKTAYQVDSRLALVFSYFSICSHCANEYTTPAFFEQEKGRSGGPALRLGGFFDGSLQEIFVEGKNDVFDGRQLFPKILGFLLGGRNSRKGEFDFLVLFFGNDRV